MLQLKLFHFSKRSPNHNRRPCLKPHWQAYDWLCIAGYIIKIMVPSRNGRRWNDVFILGLSYLQVSNKEEMTPLTMPLPMRIIQGIYPDNRRGSINVTMRKMPIHVMRASVMAMPTTNIFVTVCKKLKRKNAVTTSPLPTRITIITAVYITTKPQFILWSSGFIWLKTGVIVVAWVMTSSKVAVWPSNHPDSVALVVALLVVFDIMLNIVEGNALFSWWREVFSMQFPLRIWRTETDRAIHELGWQIDTMTAAVTFIYRD